MTRSSLPGPTSLGRRARKAAEAGGGRRLPLPLVVVVVVAILACAFLALRDTRSARSAPTVSPSTRARAVDFDGHRALEHARKLVSFGPRSVGTGGHARAVDYIVDSLKACGLAPEKMEFVARTPEGPVKMTNILATIGSPLLPASTPSPGETNRSATASRFPGTPTQEPSSADADTVVLCAHYDTKRFAFAFVGANDGASGTAALLEMARVLSARRPARRVLLVFFDGEEAMREWTAADSLYGSRHLAETWRRQDVLPRLRAFILMDMVGDADLRFARDLNSNRWLENMIWQQADSQGYRDVFTDSEPPVSIEDDHVPFVQLGVPAAVIIDFQYGPEGTHDYWHTSQDTLDKISARSLEVVGRVVEATTREL